MAGHYVRLCSLIQAVFNLAIWCSITKSPNLMYRQHFCVCIIYTCLLFPPVLVLSWKSWVLQLRQGRCLFNHSLSLLLSGPLGTSWPCSVRTEPRWVVSMRWRNGKWELWTCKVGEPVIWSDLGSQVYNYPIKVGHSERHKLTNFQIRSLIIASVPSPPSLLLYEAGRRGQLNWPEHQVSIASVIIM